MKETDILSNIKGHHPVRIRTPTVTSSTKKKQDQPGCQHG